MPKFNIYCSRIDRNGHGIPSQTSNNLFINFVKELMTFGSRSMSS